MDPLFEAQVPVRNPINLVTIFTFNILMYANIKFKVFKKVFALKKIKVFAFEKLKSICI